MRIVKISVSRIKISKKASVARGISAKMRLNSVYAPFYEDLDKMDQAAGILNKAEDDAKKMGPAATQRMYAAAAVLDNTIITVATDVDNMTANMEYENAVEVVLNAGFEVKKKGKITIPPLSVKKGFNNTSAKVRVKAVRGASYNWRLTDDITDPNKWVSKGSSTYATVMMADLQESKKYWVSVSLTHGNNTGSFCDPVSFVTGMLSQ